MLDSHLILTIFVPVTLWQLYQLLSSILLKIQHWSSKTTVGHPPPLSRPRGGAVGPRLGAGPVSVQPSAGLASGLRGWSKLFSCWWSRLSLCACVCVCLCARVCALHRSAAVTGSTYMYARGEEEEEGKKERERGGGSAGQKELSFPQEEAEAVKFSVY